MSNRDSRLNGPAPAPENEPIRFGFCYPDQLRGVPERPTTQINRQRPSDDTLDYGERISLDGDAADDIRYDNDPTMSPGRSVNFNRGTFGPFVGGGGPRGF